MWFLEDSLGIGQHATMDGRIVRQRAGGLDPHVEACRRESSCRDSARTRPGAARSAARARSSGAPGSGHHRQDVFAHFGFARQIFRQRDVRHFRLMTEPTPRRHGTTPAWRSDGRAGARYAPGGEACHPSYDRRRR